MKRENIEILIAITLLFIMVVVSIGVYFSVRANMHIISMFEDNQVNSLELQPNN